VAPDLAIKKTHTGNFVIGNDASFKLTVTNVGGITAGPNILVTVTDTLPFPLTLTAKPSGMGWDCSGSDGAGGTEVHCEIIATVPPNNSLPDITVPVHVGQTELRKIENLARVTAPGDTNPDNDTSVDIVLINRIMREAPSLSPVGVLAALLMLLGVGFFGLRRTSARRS